LRKDRRQRNIISMKYELNSYIMSYLRDWKHSYEFMSLHPYMIILSFLWT